jgi:hypothetical protein
MKISKQTKTIVQIIILIIAIVGVVYINSTATMTMGNFSGNGR